MDRREFLKRLFVGGSGVLLSRAWADKNLPFLTGSRLLPPPIVNAFSSEIVANSRLSYHDGYGGQLSDQILSNVLWAIARVPLIGSSRIIYVALPDSVYQYDAEHHEIAVHQAGNHMSEPNLAFEVGVAADLIEDSGTALHYGHLAATSFWTSTNNQPVCCPKESAMFNANNSWNPALPVHNVNCYGNLETVNGITDELVAISSNGSLPDPSTDGTILLENALANLNYGEQFLNTELMLDEISQLAWASYGCNPHYVYNGNAGLTVASAGAHYYLTGRIYAVLSDSVQRYHNRLPSGDFITRDHRIELVTAGDRRQLLRTAIARIPQTAPNYFVYCASSTDRRQLIEAGYCGAGALLQVSSMDLQGHLTADFSSAERSAIIDALSIPSNHLPLVIFSAGHTDVGIREKSKSNLTVLGATPNPFRYNTRIRYGLSTSAHVTLAIYDSVGRYVTTLLDKNLQRGHFVVDWDGTNREGDQVPSGIYYSVLRYGSSEHRLKMIRR